MKMFGRSGHLRNDVIHVRCKSPLLHRSSSCRVIWMTFGQSFRQRTFTQRHHDAKATILAQLDPHILTWQTKRNIFFCGAHNCTTMGLFDFFLVEQVVYNQNHFACFATPICKWTAASSCVYVGQPISLNAKTCINLVLLI